MQVFVLPFELFKDQKSALGEIKAYFFNGFILVIYEKIVDTSLKPDLE